MNHLPWIALGFFARVSLDIFTKAYRYRGYINRFLHKLTKIPLGFPPFLPFWLVLSPLVYFLVDKNSIYDTIVWGSYTVVAIDDYLNGDDDFHKKLKKALNKIKWKMTQPRLLPRPE